MQTQFNNGAPHCLFIGNRKLSDVIAQDETELSDVNGSFDAIASRMDSITKTAERIRNFPYDVDGKVKIVSYFTTRGMQECPFSRACRIGGCMGVE